MNRLFLFRRLAVGLLFLLLAALLLTWVAAPQVLVLLREGFPAQTWPAPGSYAQVQGASPPLSPPPGQPAPQVARDRLTQQGGRALLMDQGGTLLVEEYAQGLTRADRLNSYSLVKSLVGALTLRAVADGKIASLDDPLSAYLGAQAPDVTIRDALTMTSGLMLDSTPEKPMEDGAFSPFGGLARLHAFGLTPILPKLRADPALRGQFRYESVNTALLGAVLERAYDAPLQDTLSRLIWKPAGAARADWRRYPGGEGVSAYCCLYARPLDWLLVGRFLLDNGTPKEPFLPPDLWQALLMPDLPAEARRKGTYGYQIRHDILDRPGEMARGPFAYFLGHHGQVVYFLPDQDAVVVRFGESQQLLHSTIYDLFDAR